MSTETETQQTDTVFTTTHEQISSTAVTQCEMGKHSFQKLSENEVYCPTCQSAFIVEDITKYL